MAQLVEYLILDFVSGHDLMVHGFNPCIGLCTDSIGPAWDYLSPCLSLCHSPIHAYLSLSLSLSLKINEYLKKERKKMGLCIRGERVDIQ